MSRTYKDSPERRQRQRHISVRGVRRDPPDLRKLARALIQLAMEQAALEAAAETDGTKPAAKRKKGNTPETPDA